MKLRTEEKLRQAIAEAGLPPPATVIGDGKLHRFASNGTPSDLAGWYILHTDGVPAGAFGDWRTGTKESWCGKSDRQMTRAERDATRQRIEQIQREREAEERQRHAEAAAEAHRLWDFAQSATATHSYLQRRTCAPGNTMREGREAEGRATQRGLWTGVRPVPP